MDEEKKFLMTLPPEKRAGVTKFETLPGQPRKLEAGV
jgi:hypothetical protein